MNQSETIAAKALINTQLITPPEVDKTILSCVHSIANNYTFEKYRTHLDIATVEIVLQSLITYRRIVNVQGIGNKDGNESRNKSGKDI